MHPAVKIVSLVLLSILSTQGEWLTLLILSLLILPFYILQPDLWPSAVRMIVRLKWLFFSILTIYIIYIPENSSVHYLKPFILPVSFFEIMVQILPGLFRIAVLVIIIFSVNLFIKTTSKEHILAALLWLLFPLKLLKIDIERFSLRAVLTLEYIEVLTLRLDSYKQKKKLNENLFPKLNRGEEHLFIHFFAQKKDNFFRLLAHSSAIISEILNEAETVSRKKVVIEILDPPLAHQFLFPLFLVLLFFIL